MLSAARHFLLLFSSVFTNLAPANDIPPRVTEAHRSVIRLIIAKSTPTQHLFQLFNSAPVISFPQGRLRNEGILDFGHVLSAGDSPFYATVETQAVVLGDGETIVVPRDAFKALGIQPQVGRLDFHVAFATGTGEVLRASGGPFPNNNPCEVEVTWDRHVLLQEGPASNAFAGFELATPVIARINSPVLLRVKGGLGVAGIPEKPMMAGGSYYPGQRGGLRRAYALSLSDSREAPQLLPPLLVHLTEEESLLDNVIELIPRRHGNMDSVSEAQLYVVWERYISAKTALPRGSAIVDSSGQLLMVTMDDHVKQPRSFHESATGYGVCGAWLALMARHEVKFLKPSIASE